MDDLQSRLEAETVQQKSPRPNARNRARAFGTMRSPPSTASLGRSGLTIYLL
jgi:hypothetical protein